MNPVDVKWSTYIDFDKKNKKEDPKFKLGDNGRISKYRNIFAKDYVPNSSEEGFMIKKVKKLFCGHMFLVILTVKNYWDVLRKRIAKTK